MSAHEPAKPGDRWDEASESLAGPHNEHECRRINFGMNRQPCDCPRDARVRAIAAALRSAHAEGAKQGQWCYRVGVADPDPRSGKCSGEGRPSCTVTECMFGAEPCGHGHFKSRDGKCGIETLTGRSGGIID